MTAIPSQNKVLGRRPTAENLQATGTVSEALTIYRVVLAAILISLIWKAKYFLLGYLVYLRIPLNDDFFPLWLRNPHVFFGVYLSACLLVSYSIFVRAIRHLVWLAPSLSFCLFVLVIHQQTYNDVTFLTCWWTSIWCWWYASRIGQDRDQDLIEKGVFVAHLILSMIFLGGAVGKMTPGYWSGQVLYEIYFQDRDYWVFNVLRGFFSEDGLRQLACGYSRIVIFAEASCAFLWLLPPRMASWFALVTISGIGLLSNIFLFSVLTCLLGLAVIGLHQPRPAVEQVGSKTILPA